MQVASVRALVLAGAGADYHDQPEGHWIAGRIATPMSRYEDYRESRSSFGLNVLGTFVVEVEADDGTVGVGVSTGGPPACWLVEHHLSRFVRGQDPRRIELIWDQLWRSTLFYGRKGLVVNAISAIDLALWDLLGKLRDEPVHRLIGGAVQDEIHCYATGPRPERAKELGFIGGKLPLEWSPASGDDGLRRNLERAEQARAAVGGDFFLAYDCWMALDVPYTLRLIDGLRPYGFKWIEEFLPPDDYWGYAEVRRRAPRELMLATGEHEATRWGFRMLLEMGCCDILQPDVGWCGGLTELLKIAAYADAQGVLVIPHGSSVYSYHFVITRPSTPFAEFLMMAPDADRVVPMFSPLFVDEPVPANGRIPASALERPGFGVDLDRSLPLQRPFPV